MRAITSSLLTLLALGGFLLAQGPSAFAADGEKVKISDLVDEVKISGDLRLRHESFWKDPDGDRHRQRVRLRVKSDIKINDFKLGVRLASGTGEPVSTNQSFDNLFGQKALWLDRAFVTWQGSQTRWLKVTGGRMANPFFTVYSSDAVWDSDVNPEGFAQNLEWRSGEALALFANLGQIVLDEDSGDNNDQWLFGEQVGLSVKPAKETEATLAVAYYDFTNTKKSPLVPTSGTPPSLTFSQDGNTRVGNLLINDYNVLDITAAVMLDAAGLPLALMWDYVKNLAETINASGVETGDTGYQAGLILGKAKKAHTWELAYFYKVMETDATLADIADSDFGDGGLDRRGHIVWGAYNLTQYLQLKAKFFSTIQESQTASTKDDIDRLQIDAVFKF